MGLKIVAYSFKNYDQVGPVFVDGRVHSLSEVTTWAAPLALELYLTATDLVESLP
jgi:hypothetical protein